MLTASLLALIGWNRRVMADMRAQIPPTPIQPPDLTVMTFNILKDNSRYGDLAAAIRESGADVVLLQEVNAYFERTVARSVEEVYPHSVVHFVRPDRLALAILSKYPLGNADFAVFSEEASRLRAEISLNGRAVILYNVHLPNPATAFLEGSSGRHETAVNALLALLEAEPDAPLILGGDFNMPSSSEAHTRISEHFTDAFAQVGAGGGTTYPAGQLLPPVLRLDYLFLSPEFTPLTAYVIPDSAGSDHHPVIAALVWTEG